jgi:hypothetical protein
LDLGVDTVFRTEDSLMLIVETIGCDCFLARSYSAFESRHERENDNDFEGGVRVDGLEDTVD